MKAPSGPEICYTIQRNDIKAFRQLQDIVKRQASRYDESALTAKTGAFLQTTGKFKNYSRTVKGLSLADM